MNYHNSIMNLQINSAQAYASISDNSLLSYKLGHRDARHAAAELALSAEAMLEDYSDMIRKICFEYAARGYNSEGLLPVATADAKLRWIIGDVYTGANYAAVKAQKKADERIEELECALRSVRNSMETVCGWDEIEVAVEAVITEALGDSK